MACAIAKPTWMPWFSVIMVHVILWTNVTLPILLVRINLRQGLEVDLYENIDRLTILKGYLLKRSIIK